MPRFSGDSSLQWRPYQWHGAGRCVSYWIESNENLCIVPLRYRWGLPDLRTMLQSATYRVSPCLQASPRGFSGHISFSNLEVRGGFTIPRLSRSHSRSENKVGKWIWDSQHKEWNEKFENELLWKFAEIVNFAFAEVEVHESPLRSSAQINKW